MSIHSYVHLKKQSWILVSTVYQIFTFFVPHNKHNFQTKSTATYHTLKVSPQKPATPQFKQKQKHHPSFTPARFSVKNFENYEARKKKFRLPRNCAVETRLAGLLLLTILRTASAGILEQSMVSGNPNRNRVVVPSRSLYSLAGRYHNPIHTRFIAPIDCYKIPALGLPFAL
jgi:hypothetical protein